MPTKKKLKLNKVDKFIHAMGFKHDRASRKLGGEKIYKGRRVKK